MKKILIIEDNTDVRENLEEILQLSGYEVLAAKDGKEGVNSANSWKPDLILCDVMLPVLDGFGILQILSKNPELNSIPFIFLTAKTELSDMRKGMNLGADDYITKPFKKDELLSVIEMRLARAQEHHASPQTESKLKNTERAMGLLKSIFDAAEERNYPPGYHFFSLHDRPRNALYLQSGLVKEYNTSDFGREYIFRIHTAQNYPGIWEAYRGDPYRTFSTSITDCTTLSLPIESFREAIQKEPYVVYALQEILYRQKVNAERKLLAAAFHSVRKKVSMMLEELHGLGFGNNEHSIDINRADLSSMCGTAKETLTRTLSDFKDENLVDIQGGKIVITDLKGLQNMPD